MVMSEKHLDWKGMVNTYDHCFVPPLPSPWTITSSVENGVDNALV